MVQHPVRPQPVRDSARVPRRREAAEYGALTTEEIGRAGRELGVTASDAAP